MNDLVKLSNWNLDKLETGKGYWKLNASHLENGDNNERTIDIFKIIDPI